MLFVESKSLGYGTNGSERIHLIEGLQEKYVAPLIRSARLNCFENVLLGAERIGELETAVATWAESENQEPYVRGDLFCLHDHVLFLIFEDKTGVPLIRSGIVYESRTSEPLRKLDAFSRDVRELLITQSETQGNVEVEPFPQWAQGKPVIPEGFKRFVAKQDTDSLYTNVRKESTSRRILAATNLEDESARVFLRSAREAHQEGYAAKLLTEDTAGPYEFSIQRLEDAGLVEREVQVSCRKTEHALFRLPNAHALAVVTVSDATCSECGSPVADEKVEEVFAPTRLASSLLEDGSWLVSRLQSLLREMGVPESEIAVGPSEGDGHGQMMANICGEPFLVVVRDGDLTPAFARWAIDLEIDTEASHLVVVATGRVHNQAQVLLFNHSRRRILAGRDFELVLADGAASAGRELRDAFERVTQRVVAEQVCDLDSSLGLNVSRLIVTKFSLLRKTENVEHLNLTSQSRPEFTSPLRPLTLAAHASGNFGDAIYVGELVSDDLTASPPGEPVLDIGTHLNSD